MNEFKKNVLSIWGAQGQKWLDGLPSVVEQLASRWALSDIEPVTNMTFNYVAKAQRNKQGVVLKIACMGDELEREVKTLRFFNGQGMVKLLEYDETHHARNR